MIFWIFYVIMFLEFFMGAWIEMLDCVNEEDKNTYQRLKYWFSKTNKVGDYVLGVLIFLLCGVVLGACFVDLFRMLLNWIFKMCTK